MSWMFAFAAASLFMGTVSTMQQWKAASDAEDIGRENARLIKSEGEESARRMKREHARTQSATLARVAASGVLREGSPGDYIDDMSSEMGKELAWLKESTKRRANLAKKGGEQAGDAGRAAAIGTAAGTIGTAGQQYGDGWWALKPAVPTVKLGGTRVGVT